jgi:uncharacterized protein
MRVFPAFPGPGAAAAAKWLPAWTAAPLLPAVLHEQDPLLFEPLTGERVRSAVGERPFAFRCTACGKCCTGPGSVYFTAEDLENIYAELKLDAAGRRALRARLVQGKENGYYVHRTNGACILLNEKNQCSVYKSRPLQCRTFPFWPSTFADAASLAEVAAECPGTMSARAEPIPDSVVARRVNKMQKDFLAPQKVKSRRFMV